MSFRRSRCFLNIVLPWLWCDHSLLPSAVLADGATGIAAQEKEGPVWNLMVSMQLRKVGRYSTCPVTVISDLENEFRDWMVAEFDLILGEDNYVLTRAAGAEYGDAAEIQTIVKTSHHSPNRDGWRTIQSLTLPLQWNAQGIIDQWRKQVSFTPLDLPCMGDATLASLRIFEVPYFPTSWKSTPIILGFQTRNATAASETPVSISAF